MMGHRVLDGRNWQVEHPIFGWVDERRIPHTDRPWRPFEQTEPHAPDGTTSYPFEEGETFWANSHYLVFVRRLKRSTGAEARHLSLRTVENDTRHDWREMQRVKNELCGPEWEAIEIYPAESRLVDTANQYHLWAFNDSLRVGFGTRFVQDTDRSARIGAKQRPLRKS